MVDLSSSQNVTVYQRVSDYWRIHLETAWRLRFTQQLMFPGTIFPGNLCSPQKFASSHLASRWYPQAKQKGTMTDKHLWNTLKYQISGGFISRINPHIDSTIYFGVHKSAETRVLIHRHVAARLERTTPTFPWLIYWFIYGWRMDYVWVMYGWSMSYIWIIYGLHMGHSQHLRFVGPSHA